MIKHMFITICDDRFRDVAIRTLLLCHRFGDAEEIHGETKPTTAHGAQCARQPIYFRTASNSEQQTTNSDRTNQARIGWPANIYYCGC